MSPLEQRERAFETLERGPVDVLIVGGGIVGTGGRFLRTVSGASAGNGDLSA